MEFKFKYFIKYTEILTAWHFFLSFKMEFTISILIQKMLDTKYYHFYLDDSHILI